MYKGPSAWDRINSFALVSYIPEPLARFLDRLRQELVPNCFLRAHVTILPPRPILSSPEDAWEAIRTVAPEFSPFEIELTSVEVFPVSDVIYIKVAAGSEELRRMHAAMNISGLYFQEAFPYHPHVTLAQDLKPDELDELASVARARWAEFSSSKKLCVEKIVFVQNTRRNQWLDLGECLLGHAESWNTETEAADERRSTPMENK
jgi:2'-5' RNA ligase